MSTEYILDTSTDIVTDEQLPDEMKRIGFDVMDAIKEARRRHRRIWIGQKSLDTPTVLDDLPDDECGSELQEFIDLAPARFDGRRAWHRMPIVDAFSLSLDIAVRHGWVVDSRNDWSATLHKDEP